MFFLVSSEEIFPGKQCFQRREYRLEPPLCRNLCLHPLHPVSKYVQSFLLVTVWLHTHSRNSVIHVLASLHTTHIHVHIRYVFCNLVGRANNAKSLAFTISHTDRINCLTLIHAAGVISQVSTRKSQTNKVWHGSGIQILQQTTLLKLTMEVGFPANVILTFSIVFWQPNRETRPIPRSRNSKNAVDTGREMAAHVHIQFYASISHYSLNLTNCRVSDVYECAKTLHCEGIVV